MDIRRKVTVGGTAVLGTVFLVAAIAGYEVSQISFGGPIHRQNQQISDLVADILPPPEYLIESYLEATKLVAEPSTLPQHRARLAQLEKDFNDRYAFWQQSSLDDGLKTQLLQNSGREAKRFWVELDATLLPAVARQDMAQAKLSYERLTDIYQAHRKRIDALVVAANATQTRLAADSGVRVTWIFGLLAALGILILTLLYGGLTYVIRQALAPIGETAQAMRRMARGEFDVKVDGGGRQDEIGVMVESIETFRTASKAKAASEAQQRKVVAELDVALQAMAEGDLTATIDTRFDAEYEPLRLAFNKSVAALGDILRHVTESASSIRTGSSEIRIATDDLARRTEQQASSLVDTVAAMSRVTAMVQGTADGAVGVSASITAAQSEANEGGNVVERAVTAMNEIEKSSHEISQIINLIDGISFQTNLLALNAGVEAARAGDAGKGFAVVANEVRALAQRSAEAAKDIKDLITKSTDKVSEGVALVSETGTVLGRIVIQVGEISQLVAQISQSAEAQASSLQHVNGAVGEMEQMTQQNAAMVEESTAAARSLADESDQLAGLVSRFRVSNDAPAVPQSAMQGAPARQPRRRAA